MGKKTRSILKLPVYRVAYELCRMFNEGYKLGFFLVFIGEIREYKHGVNTTTSNVGSLNGEPERHTDIGCIRGPRAIL